jgi:hypothetical protein
MDDTPDGLPMCMTPDTFRAAVDRAKRAERRCEELEKEREVLFEERDEFRANLSTLAGQLASAEQRAAVAEAATRDAERMHASAEKLLHACECDRSAMRRQLAVEQSGPRDERVRWSPGCSCPNSGDADGLLQRVITCNVHGGGPPYGVPRASGQSGPQETLSPWWEPLWSEAIKRHAAEQRSEVAIFAELCEQHTRASGQAADQEEPATLLSVIRSMTPEERKAAAAELLAVAESIPGAAPPTVPGEPPRCDHRYPINFLGGERREGWCLDCGIYNPKWADAVANALDAAPPTPPLAGPSPGSSPEGEPDDDEDAVVSGERCANCGSSEYLPRDDTDTSFDCRACGNVYPLLYLRPLPATSPTLGVDKAEPPAAPQAETAGPPEPESTSDGFALIADYIERMVFAFDHGDSRRDEVRKLAAWVREHRCAPRVAMPPAPDDMRERIRGRLFGEEAIRADERRRTEMDIAAQSAALGFYGFANAIRCSRYPRVERCSCARLPSPHPYSPGACTGREPTP